MNGSTLFASLPLLLTGSLAAQTSSLPPSLEGEPWVIREVIRGEATNSWRFEGIVDVDRDGVVDFMAWEGPVEPENAGTFHHGGDLSAIRRIDGLYLDQPRRISSGIMLKTPTGRRLATAGTIGNQGSQIRFLEGNPLRKIAGIQVPPPSPGGPFYYSISYIIPAGDINQDGYDDLLCQPLADFGWSSWCLIDGATMAIAWINDYPHPQSLNTHINNNWPDPFQDVDGDGIKDIYLHDMDQTRQHVRCVSGATGNEIWTDVSTFGPQGSFTRTPAIIDDVSGDGIRDFLLVKPAGGAFNPSAGFLQVLSGSDGTTIWKIPGHKYNPGVLENPPWERVSLGLISSYTGDFDGDGTRDISLKVGEGAPPANNSTWEDWVWIVSGTTGEVLVREPYSTAPREPWDTGPIQDTAFRAIGDIDNDGWTEFYLERGWLSTSSQFNDFIIHGRTTLRHPSEAQEGDFINLSLHIPTGANKTFQILFSTGFDDMQNGHIVRGKWNTHLIEDSIFRASSKSMALRGTLDSKGKGRIRVRIPHGLGLAGQTLYGVALVHDPSRPEGILTKSSLAVIEVLP